VGKSGRYQSATARHFSSNRIPGKAAALIMVEFSKSTPSFVAYHTMVTMKAAFMKSS
jgi:hypothetical protein